MPTWEMIQNMRANAKRRKEAAIKNKSFNLVNRGERNRQKKLAGKSPGVLIIVDDPHDPNAPTPDPVKVKEWYTKHLANEAITEERRAEAKRVAAAYKLVGEVYTVGNTIADALHFNQLDDALRESLSKNLITIARQLAPRKRRSK